MTYAKSNIEEIAQVSVFPCCNYPLKKCEEGWTSVYFSGLIVIHFALMFKKLRNYNYFALKAGWVVIKKNAYTCGIWVHVSSVHSIIQLNLAIFIFLYPPKMEKRKQFVSHLPLERENQKTTQFKAFLF